MKGMGSCQRCRGRSSAEDTAICTRSGARQLLACAIKTNRGAVSRQLHPCFLFTIEIDSGKYDCSVYLYAERRYELLCQAQGRDFAIYSREELELRFDDPNWLEQPEKQEPSALPPAGSPTPATEPDEDVSVAIEPGAAEKDLRRMRIFTQIVITLACMALAFLGG